MVICHSSNRKLTQLMIPYRNPEPFPKTLQWIKASHASHAEGPWSRQHVAYFWKVPEWASPHCQGFARLTNSQAKTTAPLCGLADTVTPLTWNMGRLAHSFSPPFRATRSSRPASYSFLLDSAGYILCSNFLIWQNRSEDPSGKNLTRHSPRSSSQGNEEVRCDILLLLFLFPPSGFSRICLLKKALWLQVVECDQGSWRSLVVLRCTFWLIIFPLNTPIQSILKEISPEYSLEGLMLKLKLQSFGHLMRRTDSVK